jgi:nitroimidazol reductase NimA-like FMN-containing flavoprotein (pyridoxamine 5'-phosphate oxidase superfamily)
MNDAQKTEIEAILREGQDLTLATVRPDGAPQATTVSYAAEGLTIYFGCDAGSPKAHNLEHDPRVSLTVNLPYRDWSEIRGVSLFGRAQRLTDADELARAGVIFMQKFPEIAQYVTPGAEGPALYRITPEVVSILDYRKGFGHTELVEVSAADRKAAA